MSKGIFILDIEKSINWKLFLYSCLVFLLGFLGSYIAGVLNSLTAFSDVTYGHNKNFDIISDEKIKKFLSLRSIFFFVRLTSNPQDDFTEDDKIIIHEKDWDWQVCFVDENTVKPNYFEELLKEYIDPTTNKEIESNCSHLAWRKLRSFEILLEKLPNYFSRNGIYALKNTDFSTTKSILISGILTLEHKNKNPKFVRFEEIKQYITSMTINSLIINVASKSQNPTFKGHTADEFGKYIIENIYDSEVLKTRKDCFHE